MKRFAKGCALLSMTGFILTGCADLSSFVERNFNDTTTGTGPITLSPFAQQTFNKYLASTTPLYFAVSEDGQTPFYTYCDDPRCARATSKAAIYSCEKSSDGVPCKIYASGRNVIWKFDE